MFQQKTQQEYWDMLPLSDAQRKAIYDDFVLANKYDIIEEKVEESEEQEDQETVEASSEPTPQ